MLLIIYVRDLQSKQKIVDLGVTNQVHVAPDLIVRLSDFFDYKTNKQKGKNLLIQQGVDTDKSVLCFHAQPRSKAFNRDSNLLAQGDEIIRQLKRYRERTDSEIVLLPIGYCHSDDQYLQHLAKRSDGALKYVGAYSVYDIMAVIAASNVFLGTSLHGNITAFSFGIPHLFGPLNVDKITGFLDIANLSPDLKLKSWTEVNEKLDFVNSLEPAYFSSRAQIAKQKVKETFNLLYDSLCSTAGIPKGKN
jgi:exopolysaccharide biosynthesis predicted pyruvyltransferase EpsI